ncbi:unnamed protein product [Adineta steineri]|uniref:Golgin subfamily A conserved domain-containing protein n=1 Tax=Adineta steineri TaxID=433720 RepID=A0A818SZP6_9BILA|nr:unnamed protein product [Adineta steineri]CAF3677892.1 unnamed protein product [Adineta steineri]
MVDNEKRENLANARRKLKKFRDQHLPNGSDDHSTNGTSIESPIDYNTIPQNVTAFVNEQQTTLNGVSTSPIINLEEQNRQHNLSIEKQKQQRQSSGGSNVSGRSSQIPGNTEEKLRRDAENLQEQLEVHVQTIGVLVAEKTDVSAKLSQSFKQLERKQGEMDELYGRLKASRERVQELEKQMQNSTSDVQKREMAVKEFDKENDRLKIENIRHSQLIEDLKQNINELNEKLHNRQNTIDQLNIELEQFKKQPQTINDTSQAEQQITELQQTITFKNNQIEEFLSSISRMRTDNDQYQQYNTNMQHHIQELNDQINQLTQTNNLLKNKQDEKNLSDHSLVLEHDNLQQENQLFRNAIDQWSNRYEELRLKLEQMTKTLTEKDEHIIELETKINNSKAIEDKNPLIETKKEFESDEISNLKNQIQTIENLNKQLNERLEQFQLKSNHEQPTQTDEQQTDSILPLNSNDQKQSEQHLIERFNEVMRENIDLKDRIQNLDHVILQLQSETETIGDYIILYQQQREQLQKRYQEKDDYIKQLTQDRFDLQKKLSELEILLVHGLNIPIPNSIKSQESHTEILSKHDETNSSGELELQPGKNEQLGTIDQVISLNTDKIPSSISLPQLSDETKARILALITELAQNNISSNDNLSTVKRAFVDKDFYLCSTCSGSVQWV